MKDTLGVLLSVSALIIGLTFVCVIGPKKKTHGTLCSTVALLAVVRFCYQGTLATGITIKFRQLSWQQFLGLSAISGPLVKSNELMWALFIPSFQKLLEVIAVSVAFNNMDPLDEVFQHLLP